MRILNRASKPGLLVLVLLFCLAARAGQLALEQTYPYPPRRVFEALLDVVAEKYQAKYSDAQALDAEFYSGDFSMKASVKEEGENHSRLVLDVAVTGAPTFAATREKMVRAILSRVAAKIERGPGSKESYELESAAIREARQAVSVELTIGNARHINRPDRYVGAFAFCGGSGYFFYCEAAPLYTEQRPIALLNAHWLSDEQEGDVDMFCIEGNRSCEMLARGTYKARWQKRRLVVPINGPGGKRREVEFAVLRMTRPVGK